MKVEHTKGAYVLTLRPIRVALAVHAIRKREHPLWSQWHSEARAA